MNHSDTFLRHGLRSPVRPPDAIIARRFVRDLVRYHFTGLVAPIYYVSQQFFPTRSIIFICSESSVFVIHSPLYPYIKQILRDIPSINRFFRSYKFHLT